MLSEFAPISPTIPYQITALDGLAVAVIGRIQQFQEWDSEDQRNVAAKAKDKENEVIKVLSIFNMRDSWVGPRCILHVTGQVGLPK